MPEMADGFSASTDAISLKVPKKSKKNKYFHLSKAYLALKETCSTTATQSQPNVGNITDDVVPDDKNNPREILSLKRLGSSKNDRDVTEFLTRDSKAKRTKRHKIISSPLKTDDSVIKRNKVERQSVNESELCDEEARKNEPIKKKCKKIGQKKANTTAMDADTKNRDEFIKKIKTKRKNKKQKLIIGVGDTENTISSDARKTSKTQRSKLVEKKTLTRTNLSGDHCESTDAMEADERTDLDQCDNSLKYKTKQDKSSSEDAESADKSLRTKMLRKLAGSRFRYINQQLYTITGSDAYRLFNDDVSMFHAYHHGYQQQVARWPTNPLDAIIRSVRKLPVSSIVADFGCGDARLARSVPHNVRSFDLVSLNEFVTACDMSQVPLEDESVDVAVFCLSLMGTNIADYLREANRVLKTGGLLKIAEVSSRITNLHNFIKTLRRLGFSLDQKNSRNKMFIMLDFTKISKPKISKVQFSLPPCLYKPR